MALHNKLNETLKSYNFNDVEKIFKDARNKTKKLARRCKKRDWQDLCKNIQICADSSNVKGLYENTRKLFDRCVPLKSKNGTIIILDSLANVCQVFELTISLTKAKILAQGRNEITVFNIGDHTLNVKNQFKYLGPTITSNLILDIELSRRIAKLSWSGVKEQSVVQNQRDIRNSDIDKTCGKRLLRIEQQGDKIFKIVFWWENLKDLKLPQKGAKKEKHRHLTIPQKNPIIVLSVVEFVT
ncbi:hypothetical protein HELRODRAFT_164267 [Helobdella robusta]|uniref:Uncharacterized protein n=1 Tax=Helobdella robusta TaxID=6412 RepID=T1EV66_HELRO|nr:hypothetical protein HELRODRAFT_164267 [Helobdella robusta]ESN94427.1 hypothetical protein HELRODRAFT_164267 [Helobdella robusta]